MFSNSSTSPQPNQSVNQPMNIFEKALQQQKTEIKSEDKPNDIFKANPQISESS